MQHIRLQYNATPKMQTQYKIIRCSTIQYNTTQPMHTNTQKYKTIPYITTRINIIQYQQHNTSNTIQHDTIRYNTTQNNTIQCQRYNTLQ